MLAIPCAMSVMAVPPAAAAPLVAQGGASSRRAPFADEALPPRLQARRRAWSSSLGFRSSQTLSLLGGNSSQVFGPCVSCGGFSPAWLPLGRTTRPAPGPCARNYPGLSPMFLIGLSFPEMYALPSICLATLGTSTALLRGSCFGAELRWIWRPPGPPPLFDLLISFLLRLVGFR